MHAIALVCEGALLCSEFCHFSTASGSDEPAVPTGQRFEHASGFGEPAVQVSQRFACETKDLHTTVRLAAAGQCVGRVQYLIVIIVLI